MREVQNDSETQDERDKKKQDIKYAVQMHAGGGELDDMLKLEDRRHEKDNFKIRRLDHMAKSQERAAKEQRLCANNVEKTYKQGTWEMEMLTGHELSAVIQGERTRVWCRRCAGDAEHQVEKLSNYGCRGQPEQKEKHEKKVIYPLCKLEEV